MTEVYAMSPEFPDVPGLLPGIPPIGSGRRCFAASGWKTCCRHARSLRQGLKKISPRGSSHGLILVMPPGTIQYADYWRITPWIGAD